MGPTETDYLAAVDGFDERVTAVGSRNWSAPTRCCPEWSVADLVHHVADETAWVAPLLAGLGADDAQSAAKSVALDDPAAHWGRAAELARNAFAGAMPATVTLPSGAHATSDYLAEMCCDTLIHTWDLADAVDGDTTLPRELVDACAEWFDSAEAAWRDGGAVGPPTAVPEDADSQTKLLARFGRPV